VRRYAVCAVVRQSGRSEVLRLRGCRTVRLRVLLRVQQQSSGGNESQGGPVCRLVASVLERSARSARYGPHGFAMSERGKDG
jgi:hypothetical protein